MHKTVYRFDEITREFLEEDLAFESPLEPGVYPMPAFCTDVAPPVCEENEVAVFVTKKWKKVKDYRGKTVYNQDWDSDVIVELGDLPEGWYLEKPERTEEQLTKIKLNESKSVRENNVNNILVTVDGMSFDGDETSQVRMTRAILMGMLAGKDLKETKINWVLADNTVVKVSLEQLSQALILAGSEQLELWTKPYEE